jgi:hypothetical protein
MLMEFMYFVELNNDVNIYNIDGIYLKMMSKYIRLRHDDDVK